MSQKLSRLWTERAVSLTVQSGPFELQPNIQIISVSSSTLNPPNERREPNWRLQSSWHEMQEDELSTGRCMSLQAMQTLNNLRENNQLCDSILVLDDGKEIPTHRALLCACSSYFRAAFTTSLHDNSETRVCIPGISSEMMQILLSYVYLRKLELTEQNVFDVLIAADYLCILGALERCCEYLVASLKPQNVVGILTFARRHFCKDLAWKAWKYIMKSFVPIAEQSEQLFDLGAADFREIINSNNLNVRSEELVWEVCLRWIERDPEHRKNHVVSFLKCIRLGLVDSDYFMEKIKEHAYVIGCEESKPIVIEALKYMYDLERVTRNNGEVVTPAIARPRVPHEVLLALGGWSGGSPTSFIESYDVRADVWVKVEEVDPAGPRAYHGNAVIGLKVYVIGGFDGMDYFNTCRVFDIEEKKWREVAPMHARRCYVAVATLDDVIYALGGYDGNHRQNTAERYEHLSNQWTMIASMNVQRSDASACSLAGKVYIVGGFNGHECMNSAEVYDPETNQWTYLTAMRSRRSGVSCVSYHDNIYVIGGFNGTTRMCSGEKYNPKNNTWTGIPDMSNQRSNFAISVIDDSIYAIGGFNGVTTIHHVEYYEDRVNDWFEVEDMNIFRSALSACVVEDVPNIKEYIHKNRDQLMEENRQKMITGGGQRVGSIAAPNTPENNALPTATLNLQQLNMLRQLNQNMVDEEGVALAMPIIDDPEHPDPMEVDDVQNDAA